MIVRCMLETQTRISKLLKMSMNLETILFTLSDRSQLVSRYILIVMSHIILLVKAAVLQPCRSYRAGGRSIFSHLVHLSNNSKSHTGNFSSIFSKWSWYLFTRFNQYFLLSVPFSDDILSKFLLYGEFLLAFSSVVFGCRFIYSYKKITQIKDNLMFKSNALMMLIVLT